MGGFFGAVCKKDVMSDVFFGTDYHSHLGTKSAGLAAYSREAGLQRKIHNISNSPFRTQFEGILEQMHGTAAIGCINDTDPQPLIMRSSFGSFAIITVGVINNKEELIDEYFTSCKGQLNATSSGVINSTELTAAFINSKSNIVDGIMKKDMVVEFSGHVFECLDKGFGHNEAVDVVGRPEEVDVVPVEKGMLTGTVTSVTFKGVHYEIIVDIGGFLWMIQSTDVQYVGDRIGLLIEPDAIHIMKKSEYSGQFGDFSSYSEEFDELSDVNAGIDTEDTEDE